MIYMLFNLYSLISILLLIFILIPFTVLICIVIWVYRDAKKRNLNAAVWVLIVWIIPFFIGFIYYLLFRKKHNSVD